MGAWAYIMGIWLLCGIIPAFFMLKTAYAEGGITANHLVFSAVIIGFGVVSSFFGIVYWLTQHGDSVVIPKRIVTKSISKQLFTTTPEAEQVTRKTLYPERYKLGSWQ